MTAGSETNLPPNEPRRGLWALMGRKQETSADPVSDQLRPNSVPDLSDSSDPAANSASLSESDQHFPIPAVDTPSSHDSTLPGEELDSPPLPIVKGTSEPIESADPSPSQRPVKRGLWSLMRGGQSEEAGESHPTSAVPPNSVPPDAGSPIEKRLVRRDHRLQQLASLQSPDIAENQARGSTEADLYDIVEATGIDDQGIQQLDDTSSQSADEVDALDPSHKEPVSDIRSLPSAILGSKEAQILHGIRPAVSTGRSRSAIWCIVLGTLSVPLSLLAILPGFLTRLPSSVFGFTALLLGLLAFGEVNRSRGKVKGAVIAAAGTAFGLFGMFAGPLIIAPLDVYGYLCDQYTQAHLQQIAIALDTYHQSQHAYPSGGLVRITQSGESQPMHGWMAQLLPFLSDHSVLASKINWQEPYDAPANLAVFQETIPEFLAAGGSQSLIRQRFGPAHFSGLGGLTTLPDGSTAHLGIFDSNSDVTRDEITDGLSTTLIAGEIADDYPAWGEPKNWRNIGKGLNRTSSGFGNSRKSGALFLMADGSVRYFSNQTDLRVLNNLSTRDGAEAP